MVQTRFLVKSNGMKLPEVHRVDKILDLHAQPEKQVIKPVIPKTRDVLQIKPRLGQGREGLRNKVKIKILTLLCKL